MNIKSKLIEQITVLEKAQDMALKHNDPTTTSISMVILDYMKHIDSEKSCFRYPEQDCTLINDNYICPNCEEAMANEKMHQEISNTCGLPIELVKRVLTGQDEVLGIER